jgi:hypothetical protein
MAGRLGDYDKIGQRLEMAVQKQNKNKIYRRNMKNDI